MISDWMERDFEIQYLCPQGVYKYIHALQVSMYVQRYICSQSVYVGKYVK